jgi:hypothetical protein
MLRSSRIRLSLVAGVTIRAVMACALAALAICFALAAPPAQPAAARSASASVPSVPARSATRATPSATSAQPADAQEALSTNGQGYWLVASDGGIFTFGDAGYFGSTGSMALNKPIVGMAATPDDQGYWLVASDGGIFSFGDARFWGSTGAMTLNKPIVGMTATPDGHGYWLVASDGGIFTFGDAGYFGSVPAAGDHVGDIVAMAGAANGQGYWIAGADGGINSFGTATSDGSAAGKPLNRPIVGFSAAQPPIPSTESSASLAISTTSVATASVGVPYGATLTATGGTPAYSWALAAGALPAGLHLNANGTITGTPNGQGHASFTVEVTDNTTPTAQTAFATLSIVVGVAHLTVTTKNLPNAVIGTWYSVSLTAVGGTAPYSWELAGGSLPAGLSLQSNGTIVGTPTAQVGTSFSVQAIDSSTPTPTVAAAALTIAVFPMAGTTGTPTRSTNWSGYSESGGPFSEVTGTFNVPTLPAGTPQGDQMSEWVGIDGAYGGNSLIQAGFNESPAPGTPAGFFVQPWWEILPSSETFISSVHIAAGDRVTVGIDQISGTNWSITLTDDTNGESFTTDQTYSGPGTTAEWIVEALTENGTVVSLAPYLPNVNFSDLGFVGANALLEEIVMWQIQNNVSTQVSTPSTLTANGFNVAYGAAAPSPP